jgi:hypothetical protein
MDMIGLTWTHWDIFGCGFILIQKPIYGREEEATLGREGTLSKALDSPDKGFMVVAALCYPTIVLVAIQNPVMTPQDNPRQNL